MSPTGYTADLYDGKPQTFTEFAMACARAFGATIMMREDDANAEITDRSILDESTYHERALVEAEVRLKRLDLMTQEQKDQAAYADYVERKESHERGVEKNTELEERYSEMLEQVELWAPPTPEHASFKKFMINQLRSSIEHDCHVWPEPQVIDAAEWEEQQRASIDRDLGYHAAEIVKQRERNVKLLFWVRELRESLEKHEDVLA